jgi:hypothetical protein
MAQDPRRTPLAEGEPASINTEGGQFWFDERDSFATIQGLVPEGVTKLHNKPAQQVLHWDNVIAQPADWQARFFLNANWDFLLQGQADRIYDEWKIFCDIQKQAVRENPLLKQREGLDENGPNMNLTLSTKFMTTLKRVKTAQEFKDDFKTVDSNFDGKMAFAEYLLYDAKQSPAYVMYRPQRRTVALINARNVALQAERKLRKWFDDEKAIMDRAKEGGAKGKKAEAELSQYRNNTPQDDINKEIAAAHNKLLSQYRKAAGDVKSQKNKGDLFWEKKVADELNSLKSQRNQRKK